MGSAVSGSTGSGLISRLGTAVDTEVWVGAGVRLGVDTATGAAGAAGAVPGSSLGSRRGAGSTGAEGVAAEGIAV